MIYWILIATLLLFVPLNVYAQSTTVTVNQTDPCFLNYTAGAELWRQCGASDDYLAFALAPWEWISGGYFSMIVVSMFIMGSYIKYHKAVYPLLIGIFFLPVSAALFPDSFIIWAILMAGVTFGILIWYIFIRQTKEY